MIKATSAGKGRKSKKPQPYQVFFCPTCSPENSLEGFSHQSVAASVIMDYHPSAIWVAVDMASGSGGTPQYKTIPFESAHQLSNGCVA
jgi:hypothetical protein